MTQGEWDRLVALKKARKPLARTLLDKFHRAVGEPASRAPVIF